MKPDVNLILKEIEPKILSRGRRILDKNLVLDYNCDENSCNFYVGSENSYTVYNVQIDIQDNQVVNATCDCPYDWGDYCKHIVAVLLYIQEFGIDEKKGNIREEISNPIEQIVEKLPKEELARIIINRAKNDKELYEYILSRYNHLLEDKSRLETLKRIINQMFQNISKYEVWETNICKHISNINSFFKNILPSLSDKEEIKEISQLFYRNLENHILRYGFYDCEEQIIRVVNTYFRYLTKLGDLNIIFSNLELFTEEYEYFTDEFKILDIIENSIDSQEKFKEFERFLNENYGNLGFKHLKNLYKRFLPEKYEELLIKNLDNDEALLEYVDILENRGELEKAKKWILDEDSRN